MIQPHIMIKMLADMHVNPHLILWVNYFPARRWQVVWHHAIWCSPLFTPTSLSTWLTAVTNTDLPMVSPYYFPLKL